jgi:hypothetical protein
MHPLFTSLRRLGTYLVGWLIVAVLIAAVSTRLGLSWVESLTLLVPLFFVYSFVCLSAWYVCRATPLGQGSDLRVIVSCGFAAIVSGSIWLGLVRTWIIALGSTAMFAEAASRYEQQIPYLFALGVLLYLVAIAVHYALIAVEAAGEAERQRLQADVLTREAELRALRAQVDPHFLYNSLNSISALTASDPAGARRMCILLADFLRNTLSVSAHENIRLADELALADRFLDIEQVRFGSRLKVERRIDESAADCLVPPLILQPLFENAVTHGIAGMLDGGLIRLDVSLASGLLSIAIENPRDGDTPAPNRLGLGLENVRKRLAVMFGDSARLSTRSEAERFRVQLELPWSTGSDRSAIDG